MTASPDMPGERDRAPAARTPYQRAADRRCRRRAGGPMASARATCVGGNQPDRVARLTDYFLTPTLSKAFFSTPISGEGVCPGFSLPGFDAEVDLVYQRRQRRSADSRPANSPPKAFQHRGDTSPDGDAPRGDRRGVSALAANIMQPIAPEARVAKNAEIVKQDVRAKGLAHARELYRHPSPRLHTEGVRRDHQSASPRAWRETHKSTSKSAVGQGA